jgi:hypothetical protein
MRWTRIAVAVAGLAVSGVGILWFLQGSDLVHIEPIACAGECEPIAGHHPEWQVAGGVAVLVGVITTTLATRPRRH